MNVTDKKEKDIKSSEWHYKKYRPRQVGISIYQLLVLFITLSIIFIVFINNYETTDTKLTVQDNVLRHELIVMRSAITQYHTA
ncbi:hypothetical protein [Methylophaga thalassica]|uniref:hypothetical protein n=1 Tax=Methylophaga aminisulfidivorans TaxID=230105 RepID=UPI003A8DB1E2